MAASEANSSPAVLSTSAAQAITQTAPGSAAENASQEPTAVSNTPMAPKPNLQFNGSPMQVVPAEKPPNYEDAIAGSATVYTGMPMQQSLPSLVMMPYGVGMAGSYCSHCQKVGTVETYNTCALICVITMTILWFPLGLCCILWLPLTKIRRCVHCGHEQRRSMTPIYVTFVIALVVQIGLVAAYIVLRVQYSDTKKY